MWKRLVAGEMKITQSVKQASPAPLLTALNLRRISREDAQTPLRGSHLSFWHVCLGFLKESHFPWKSTYVNMWATALGFSTTNKLMAVTVNPEDFCFERKPNLQPFPTCSHPASDLKHSDSQSGRHSLRACNLGDVLLCTRGNQSQAGHAAESKHRSRPSWLGFSQNI